MFHQEVYINRRELLKKKLQAGIVLLLGNEEVGMNCRYNPYAFRQDSSFLYFAGLDLPGLAVVMDIDRDETILFGHEITLEEVIWTGPLPALSEQAAAAGISITRPYQQLEEYLKKAKAQGQDIHFLPVYREAQVLKLHQWLNLSVQDIYTAHSVSLIKAIVDLRSYKSAGEVAEMEKATEVSHQMHRLFMKALQSGVTEVDLSGQLHGLALSAGGNISFPIIMTMNGEILHTHARSLKMESGRLALCDAGAETAMHYAGDLTRTVPVSGKFTEQQKNVYQIVLEAQQKGIEAAQPGVLYRDVHALVARYMVDGLKAINLIKGDADAAFARDAHTLFFPHGLGHMIGLDVHDMESLGEEYVGYTDAIKKPVAFGWKSLRLGRKLEAGFTLTVEPGIYFIPALIDQWKAENRLADFINYAELEKYRDFGGIRIEDDVLITESGNRVLGNQKAPKTIADIEHIMNS